MHTYPSSSTHFPPRPIPHNYPQGNSCQPEYRLLNLLSLTLPRAIDPKTFVNNLPCHLVQSCSSCPSLHSCSISNLCCFSRHSTPLHIPSTPLEVNHWSSLHAHHEDRSYSPPSLALRSRLFRVFSIGFLFCSRAHHSLVGSRSVVIRTPAFQTRQPASPFPPTAWVWYTLTQTTLQPQLIEQP